MDNERVARELMKMAKELVGGNSDTFKCPDCGTKVLENTGYCLKCKKKVKKAARNSIMEVKRRDLIQFVKSWADHQMDNHSVSMTSLGDVKISGGIMDRADWLSVGQELAEELSIEYGIEFDVESVSKKHVTVGPEDYDKVKMI